MKPALRTLAAVVRGQSVAFVLVIAVELFSAVVYPPPDDFDGTTEATGSTAGQSRENSRF